MESKESIELKDIISGLLFDLHRSLSEPKMLWSEWYHGEGRYNDLLEKDVPTEVE